MKTYELYIYAHVRSHPLTHPDNTLHKHTWTSVVTLRLTRCVPSYYRYLIGYYKHTLKSVTASLQWNNMYMFIFLKRNKKVRIIIMQRLETSGLQFVVWLKTGGGFPLSSFCGETSFYFLKTVKTTPLKYVKYIKIWEVQFYSCY